MSSVNSALSKKRFQQLLLILYAIVAYHASDDNSNTIYPVNRISSVG